MFLLCIRVGDLGCKGCMFACIEFTSYHYFSKSLTSLLCLNHVLVSFRFVFAWALEHGCCECKFVA